ncbi:putative Molybdate ABC transporter, ATPase subunit [Candidatus Methylacidithermus pantelleriae]|uniref:Putative Molybdate ABC transporter, ATPase subunit n=1 Tax=Candidatus Methylacidithermus pantelleriae TaxID=2744239 RepID=A0A8J2BQ62_9BACT|nr:putative Molybdate ABC transporter, ATPase subunit [Candidatus Methylacidithermus pantelleriae]
MDLPLPDGPGEVLGIFGPVGAGKTTLLRCLAGLAEPLQGQVVFRGKRWWQSGQRRRGIAVEMRGIGWVPAKPVLFPHLSVEHNIAYGLRRWPSKEREKRVEKLLELFGLAKLRKRAPRELSSGQAQLVCLARSVAPRPSLLLLDEPFAALDPRMRPEIRWRLGTLLAEEGIPAVMVSHQLEDMAALADRVVLLQEGRACFFGGIQEAFWQTIEEKWGIMPEDMGNVLFGRVTERTQDLAKIEVGGTELLGPDPGGLSRWCAAVFPSSGLPLASSGNTTGLGDANQLAGTVSELRFRGSFCEVRLDCGFFLHARLTRQEAEALGLSVGSHVGIAIPVASIKIIPRGRLPREQVFGG